MINTAFVSIFALSNDTNTKNESGVIVVDVIKNDHDEEYIKNIVLDDGSKVGDHDYVINYSTKATRGTSLPSFYYAAYITRDGVVSLSLDPVFNVRQNKTVANDAWNNEILNPANGIVNDYRWKNAKVMKWQYDCHGAWARDKEYWNLEPHRVANSYLYVELKRCNP